LDKIGAEDVIAGQTEASDDKALKKLPDEAWAAFGFGCRAGCGGICRKGLRIGRLHVRVHHVRQDELLSRVQQGAKLPSGDGYFTEEEGGKSKHQDPGPRETPISRTLGFSQQIAW
jgi:hypothetical protein